MADDQPPEVARDAVAALIGLSSVSATTQDGAELRIDPQSVDGFVIRALVPRLSLFGVQTVKLRWSVAGKPWVADAALDDAEFHSTEQALAVFRVEAAEPADLGREAARAELHAPGVLRAVHCVNAVSGNEYPVRIDDASETGVRISSEFAVTRNDEFELEFEVRGRRLHLEAQAVAVRADAGGTCVTGARITGFGPGDLRTLRELVAGLD
jgi:hypothetical protein